MQHLPKKRAYAFCSRLHVGIACIQEASSHSIGKDDTCAIYTLQSTAICATISPSPQENRQHGQKDQDECSANNRSDDGPAQAAWEKRPQVCANSDCEAQVRSKLAPAAQDDSQSP